MTPAKQDAERSMPSGAIISRFAAQMEPVYRMFNWHWWNGAEGDRCGVPSADKIASVIWEQCEHVASKDCVRSTGGGIWAEWDAEFGRIIFGFSMNIEANQDE